MRGPLLFEWLEISCEVASWSSRIMHTVGTVVHQGGGYYIVANEGYPQLTAIPVSCLTRPPQDVSTDPEADSHPDPASDRPGDDPADRDTSRPVEGLGGVGTVPFPSDGGFGVGGGRGGSSAILTPCAGTADSVTTSRALQKAQSGGR